MGCLGLTREFDNRRDRNDGSQHFTHGSSYLYESRRPSLISIAEADDRTDGIIQSNQNSIQEAQLPEFQDRQQRIRQRAQ